MNDPVKHHYSPQTYLKRWCGSDGRLFRYHRPYNRTVVSALNPEYTGFEENLYKVSNPSDPYLIEKRFFSPIDNDAAPIIKQMVEIESDLTILERRHFGDAQRTAWALFILSLHLRGPHSLSEINDVLSRLVRENIERKHGAEYLKSKASNEPDSIYEYAKLNEPQIFADAHKYLLTELILHEQVGSHVINMVWAVLDVSRARYALLTSDRPLIMPKGLLAPDCLIGVPLSPHRLFVAANNARQIEIVGAQPVEDTVFRANNLVVRLAVQNVYGNTKERRDFVDKRLRRPNESPMPGLMMGPSFGS